MTIKKITVGYILFLTVIVLGFDSHLLPKPYELARHFAPLAAFARRFPYRVPYDDKIAHFFLVGMLALFVNLSLSLASFSLGKLKILKGSLFLLIFSTCEETSQLLFPWRSFSLGDLSANYAGILCFSWAAVYLVKHKAAILPKLPRALVPLLQGGTTSDRASTPAELGQSGKRMLPPTRSKHLMYCLTIVVALGLASRVFHTGTPLWDKYLGDGLYAVMCYLLLSLFWKKGGLAAKASLTMLLMILIESFQLTRISFGFHQSSNLLLRLLSIVLGTTFAWADLVSYGVGIFSIFLLEYVYDRTSPARQTEVTG